jgi:cytochrome oxidase Cu insertion factor (SCO1/SenC/PrrC family)
VAPSATPSIAASPTSLVTTVPTTAPSVTAVATATLVPIAGLTPSPTIGLKPGQVLPDFSLTGLDGKAITSVDLLAQKKPYILFFFATW